MQGEIIVIDNASSDGYPARLAKLYPIVRVVRNKFNKGFSAGNNQAIQAAQGRYLLVSNDDVLLQEDSLRLMIATLTSDSRIAAVGPRLLNPDGSLQRGFTNRRFPRFRSLVFSWLGVTRLLESSAWTRDLLTHSRDPEVSGETDHLAGACLLLRRDALESVGLFEEGFYYWFEDADLCYRLKEAGWKIVYQADARVTHYGSTSAKTLMRNSERRLIYFRSLAYFCKRHMNSARYFPLRSAVTAALSLQLLIDVLSVINPKAQKSERWRDSVGRSLRDLH